MRHFLAKLLLQQNFIYLYYMNQYIKQWTFVYIKYIHLKKQHVITTSNSNQKSCRYHLKIEISRIKKQCHLYNI